MSQPTDVLCPEPLVSFNSYQDSTIVAAYNCAVPCPTIVYTHGQWRMMQRTIAVLIYISFIASLLTFISHVYFQKGPNLYIRKMFISGFLGNSFMISLFMLSNQETDSVVCHGDTHYVKNNILCIAQAFCTIFFLLWTEVWASILALDTYLHIISYVKISDIKSLHKKYTIAAVILSLVPCLIPLILGNLGFDPYANIPICLFLSQDDGDSTSKYFWGVFFWPFYFFLFITIALTVLGACRLHKVFVTSNSYFNNSKSNPSIQNLTKTVSSGELHGSRLGRGADDLSSVEIDDDAISGDRQVGNSNLISYKTNDNDSYDIYNGVSEGRFNDDLSISSSALSSTIPPSTTSTVANPLNFNIDNSTNSNISIGNVVSRDLTRALYSGPSAMTTPIVHPDLPRGQHNQDLLTTSKSVNRSLISELHSKEVVDLSMSYNADGLSYNLYSDANDESYRDAAIPGQGESRISEGSEQSAFTRGNTPVPSTDRPGASNDGRFAPIFKTFKNNISNSQFKSAVSNIWKYNGRSIQFVVVFCITTLCVAPCTLHVYYFEYHKYIDSTNSYVECLMETALTAQLTTPGITQVEVNRISKDACGSQPSTIPPLWEVMIILVWVAAYGIVPAIIFGGSLDPIKWLYSKCKHYISQTFGAGTTSENSNGDRYITTDSKGNVVRHVERESSSCSGM